MILFTDNIPIIIKQRTEIILLNCTLQDSMEKNSTTGDGYFNGGFLKGWTVRRNKTHINTNCLNKCASLISESFPCTKWVFVILNIHFQGY